MLIDLSRVLTHEGKKLNMTIEPSGDSYVCEMGSFPYVGKNSVSLTIAHTENQVIRYDHSTYSMFQMSGECGSSDFNRNQRRD